VQDSGTNLVNLALFALSELEAQSLRAGSHYGDGLDQSTVPPSGLEAYGLEAYIALLRYLLVPLYLNFCNPRCFCILTHDPLRGVGSRLYEPEAIFDHVEIQK